MKEYRQFALGWMTLIGLISAATPKTVRVAMFEPTALPSSWARALLAPGG